MQPFARSLPSSPPRTATPQRSSAGPAVLLLRWSCRGFLSWAEAAVLVSIISSKQCICRTALTSCMIHNARNINSAASTFSLFSSGWICGTLTLAGVCRSFVPSGEVSSQASVKLICGPYSSGLRSLDQVSTKTPVSKRRWNMSMHLASYPSHQVSGYRVHPTRRRNGL